MTPAINYLKEHNWQYFLHSYQHDIQCNEYGLEAAEKLGLNPNRVFKTLVVKLDDNQNAVALVSVSCKLKMKLLAKAAQCKKAEMAEKKEVQRSTGYVLGGVSPIGQKRRLPTYVDVSAQNFQSIFVSAGKRGLELELTPKDLLVITQGSYAQLT